MGDWIGELVDELIDGFLASGSSTGPTSSGDRVFLVQQSANRDAGTFADPDRFDITRPAQPLHVGFGRGIHGCLGARLARIEARLALPKILGRLEDIRCPTSSRLCIRPTEGTGPCGNHQGERSDGAAASASPARSAGPS